MNVQLYNAIKNNDLAELENLIADGCDINNEVYNTGLTALHLAVINDHVQIIQKLLDIGADITKEANDGFSALHLAIIKGNLDIVQKLLDTGQDITGCAVLHFTISKGGNIQIIQKLIDAVADINQKDNDGWSALHIAVNEGNIDVIKKLLDAGADINQKNGEWSALHIAIHDNNQNLIHYLLDAGADPTNLPGNPSNGSLLSYAVHANYDLKIIKLLLDKGYSNAGNFDLNEEDFCKHISDAHLLEVYKKIKLVKFIHSKGKICKDSKDSDDNRTFFDLITNTDIKDQNLPYTFDQASVDEICTELNKHINVSIASQMMDIMNRMAVRKILIENIEIEHNKYQNDESSEKKKIQIFEINFDCIQHLLNKLSNKDIFNFNRSVCKTCVDEVQNEVQVDLNNPNIQVECENYTNETQTEESENNTYVHTIGEI
ncbi:ankyrin repeat domain-containing protein [Orientia tsutsugamushi]|uniref:Ankyrin repeat-containing protein 14 n=1 Tax=Orientia tsutsugamushi TaxID=784 RepID=A0A2U3RSF6_ORITS|nr:ankyrin repeat domain-containing protein [Orientia tsutsugamushi]KJV51374.1 ankyrin repeat family protein [Orientia tsutsugamushi str. Karp]SPR16142.1 ankyrin repeat-containing protein 14 [Orientia tsutsugamushi]